jgi:hypothetical protein
LYRSMYCLCVNVYVLLPPGDNPIAVNKYIISYVTEKSSDTTGNRSRDRPTSSAAP